MADGLTLHDPTTLRPEQRAAVFEAAPDPVKVLNAQGIVLRANLAAQRVHGMPKDRLVGRSVLDFVAPEQRDNLRAGIAAAAAGRACVLDVSARAHDGSNVWWEAQLYPLDTMPLDATHCDAVVMSCRDITATRRRDADLSGQARILRAIAECAPVNETLDACCRLAEQALDGGHCCVLLHESQGGVLPSIAEDPDATQPAAPADPLSLPAVLIASLHDVQVDDGAGQGGSDVARFRLVVAPYDPLTPHQAAAPGDARLNGPSACWSLPLRAGGRIVGAFAAYVRATRPPSDTALAQIWHCANLAAMALGQVAARQALAESETRFRVAADIMPGFLWVADPAGNLTYVNRSYRERTGHTAEELIDGAWLQTIHPDDQAMCEQLWAGAIAEGADVEGRYRIRMTDGTYRWYLERGMPQRAPDGTITAWVGIAVDIEELIAGREAIQRYRTELEALVTERTAALSQTASELNAETSRREQAMEALAHKHKIDALGQLTAGVAHDFNNLLVAIMGGFQLIELRAQDPSIQQLTRNGLHASERAASLVRQLLSVARREPPRPEQIDLYEALPGMQDLLRHALTQRQTLTLDVPRETWPVFVDAAQLETALLNLAVNARDAMDDGGTLTISAANQPAAPVGTSAGAATGASAGTSTGTSSGAANGNDSGRKEDSIIITVADTGNGIPPQLLERVCDPFFTTKPRGEGTGLGLAMVKNFVTAAGGDIRLESTQGVGTRIMLRLPRALPVAAVPRVAPPPEPAAHRETVVLVVEDDEAVRPITCTFLRDAGFRVLEAASGAVALALLQVAGDIDILVTDLAMPSMDGLQLAQAVRAARPNLPAVLVTSHASGHDLSDEIVVRKPFTSTELTQAVALALGRQLEPPRRHDRLLTLMRSSIIREAYMTWQALRGDQALPRFGALTVAGRAWAESSFLIAVDRQAEPPRFRWVSVGRALMRYLPYPPNTPVEESSRTEALLGPLEQIYLGCLADQMPHFQAVEMPLDDGGSALAERLLMPVTSEVGGITHLLGIIALDDAPPPA